jgi:hypothetical protein
MHSKIAIHVNYTLYEITHLQYMFVIYLFYYAFTLIWKFYIKINMHKKIVIYIFFYMHNNTSSLLLFNDSQRQRLSESRIIIHIA